MAKPVKKNLKIIELDSLSKFSRFIEKTQQKNRVFWFRGAVNSKYHLIPSLYRHSMRKKLEELIQMEAEIIERFKLRCIPYLSNPGQIHNEWSSLFLMQHFGVPTRLLDWTENPFISLFFALSEYSASRHTGTKYEGAVVWVLNTQQLNSKSIDKVNFNGEILSCENHHLSGYKPLTEIGQLSTNPVAIFGYYNSPRIVSQKGAFTIFGSSLKPLDELVIEENYPTDTLIKIVIPKKHIPKMLESLIGIGVTDSVVYPDLDGLAKELKRLFRFEV